MLNTLFQTNNVLAFLLLIGAVYGGRWFGKVAWPDIVQYLRNRDQVAQHRMELELEADIERTKREGENDRLMLETLTGLAGEQRAMVSVLETQQHMLIQIMRSVNGSSRVVEESLAEVQGATKDSHSRR